MYRNKILSRDKVRTLESEGILRCVCSPLLRDDNKSYITIDVYIHDIAAITKSDKETKLNEDQLIFMYIHNTLKASLFSMKVSGFENIVDVSKMSVSIDFSLYNEIPLNRYFSTNNGLLNGNINDYYFIKLNTIYMNYNFILISQVVNLLKVVGITEVIIIEDKPEWADFIDMDLIVKLPLKPSWYPPNLDYTPIKLVNTLIKKEEKELKERKLIRKNKKDLLLLEAYKHEKLGEIDKAKDKIKLSYEIKLYEESSDLNLAANYVYTETTGSDFRSLMLLDDIDQTKSYTNNYHMILKFYGIEAVRTVIIKELLSLMKANDSYVDPRHIVLVADWMTMLGYITPITAKGMTMHELGPLANANFKQASAAVKSYTMFNKKDNLTNISSAITAGRLFKAGTGIVNIVVDENKVKEKLSKVRTIQKQVISSDINKELLELATNGEQIDYNELGAIPSLSLSIPLRQFPVQVEYASTSVTFIPSEYQDISFDVSKFPGFIPPKLKEAAKLSVKCEPREPEMVITKEEIPPRQDMETLNVISEPVEVVTNLEDYDFLPPDV